jgi:hypothetical protein
MLSSSLSSKGTVRPRVAPAKARPRLFLSLHTMPQTGSSHFFKWLFLALLIFGLLALAALAIFWS